MCGGAIRSSYGKGWGEGLGGCQGFKGRFTTRHAVAGFQGINGRIRIYGLFPDAARRVATGVE